ncbi:MAG: Zn-dependent hydrolase [Desulfobacterales bacterium]|nr:Zn-dependent hydrolase [Desulfobacterales bacterium]
MDSSNLRIDGKRLRQSLENMAEIGATAGGGVHRLTLSDEDKRARDLFVAWLKELDLEVVVDEMGNIFGRRAGRNNALAPVMTGSHIDTQPSGGRFDGILGVMGALEVMRTIHGAGLETERPLVVADWTNEEGSRFAPAMMGSGVWTQKLDRNWAYARTDSAGRRFVDELERIGYRGAIPATLAPVHAYYEYHIEQGPVLEREGKTIGVPKGIFGILWCDVTLEGTANQVGPTPMEGRNDALCAAAEMILAINSLPARMGGGIVATVGEIHNRPNSRNIIPDRVHFTVDIRSWDEACIGDLWAKAREEFRAIAEKRGCGIQVKEIWRVAPMPFSEHLVARVAETARGLGLPALSMLSGAGHDAGYLSLVAPTAMIFVPSIGGRSHVEVENTRWEHCAAGADVLLHCILASANER